jgi:serine/threonine protein phosphatase PrpC
MEMINRASNDSSRAVDIQSISTALIQLGEQLSLALVGDSRFHLLVIDAVLSQKLLHQDVANADGTDGPP